MANYVFASSEFELMFVLIAGILGLVLGSFFNVVIGRYKTKESICFPSSHCPKCGNGLKAYENIPVLSYLFLKGKCSNCKLPISLRYPAIELLTGAIYALIFLTYGLSLATLYYFAISAIFINLFFIDLDNYELPEYLTLPGIVVAVLGEIYANGTPWDSVLIGAFSGVAIFTVIYFIGKILFKKESIGGGDIVLMGMIGAMVQVYHIPFLMLISAIFGLMTHGLFYLLNRKDCLENDVPLGAVPFGPSLILATVVCVVFEKQLMVFFVQAMMYVLV